jgi:hypothetical protein
MNYLRQLCEELHNALAEYDSADAYRDHSGLLRRARATLAGNPDAALLPPNHNEDEIKRWLLNEYPISPDWMAYANSSGEEFKGYHLDSVSHIILQALARFGSSNPLPADYIDPEHTGADRELLRVFYRAGMSEPGTADESYLRGLKAVLRGFRAEPIPVTELPWEQEGWRNAEGKCWFYCKTYGDWAFLDPLNMGYRPPIERLFPLSLPWWAIPLPAADAGEVQGNG